MRAVERPASEAVADEAVEPSPSPSDMDAEKSRQRGEGTVMSETLAGQVALVTGGSRGIGRAIALRLAAAGATVVVNYRENAPAAEETVRLIAAAGGRACAARFDVSDAEAVRVGVQTIVDEHGRLDLLVNNAGLAVDALLLRLKEEDWSGALAPNLPASSIGPKPPAGP